MYEELKNKVVMVTGATGLIGQALVRRLLSLDSRIIAVIRNVDKAKKLFGDNDRISYVISDITEIKIENYGLDFIIHAAANTSSKTFVSNPVEIISTAIDGTKKTLEIARINRVDGYVFLSSMEIYGTPVTDERIDENYSSNLNTMLVRSSYPESKRVCESLCSAYASQYDVPAKVVRLTQTFGPGVQYDDSRVFAEFARSVIEEKDIILHTAGETKRSYLYIEDAVDAILTVLLKGKKGEAYNAANEDTYCSIIEMAFNVAKIIAHNRIRVRIEESDSSLRGYAPVLHMNLDSSKLQKLDWRPKTGIIEMFDKMIGYMKQNKQIL